MNRPSTETCEERQRLALSRCIPCNIAKAHQFCRHRPTLPAPTNSFRPSNFALLFTDIPHTKSSYVLTFLRKPGTSTSSAEVALSVPGASSARPGVVEC